MKPLVTNVCVQYRSPSMLNWWATLAFTVLVAAPVFLCGTALDTGSRPLTFVPSQIQCTELSQSYPETMFTKLFSSEPRRTYAIENVTVRIGCHPESLVGSSGVTLVVGASGSGKSVLLRLLAGKEIPMRGTVHMNGRKLLYRNRGDNRRDRTKTSLESPPWGSIVGTNVTNGLCDKRTVQPIIIDRYYQKDSCSASTSNPLKTVEGYLLKLGRDYFPGDLQHDDVLVLSSLIRKILSIVGISPVDSSSCPPHNLSVSNQLLFRIACACIESVVPSMSLPSLGSHSDVGFRAPVLLLDEFLDSESTVVAQRVGRGLHALSVAGAVVVIATHKPYHFTADSSIVVQQKITLVGGRVLIM
jgi:energy-coupling factor transporter ATP-binding protein EcfA2